MRQIEHQLTPNERHVLYDMICGGVRALLDNGFIPIGLIVEGKDENGFVHSLAPVPGVDLEQLQNVILLIAEQVERDRMTGRPTEIFAMLKAESGPQKPSLN